MQFSGHPVSFFFPWRFVSRELYRSVMADFRDNGAENLVIVQEWMERILADHVFYLDLLETVRDAGLKPPSRSRLTAPRRTASTNWRGTRRTSATGPSPW